MTGRDRFGSRLQFFFAAVGSAVGFGNVWRFPSLAYEYGGGAFFIPYLLALFLIGIPILFLEIGLGQYYQRGDVSVFASFHKRMRGVGLSSIVCGYIVLTYYSMLISWVLRCLFESGTDSAPWQDENVGSDTSVGYFFNTIIGMDTEENGLDATRILGVNVGYSFLTYTLVFLCVAFGLEATGKVTYITMGLPVVLLFIFLIRGCTLEGSSDGIKAYIGEWDMTVLKDGAAWSTAVSQIFFSLSVCFGIMTAYGSHMPANEPAFQNSCVIAIANSMFSFLSGFAVFSAIGHAAHLKGVEVSGLDNIKSFGLVFGTWPVVLGSLPGGIHWIRLLFFNLFLLGVDSAFSFIEGVVTCVKDTEKFRDTPKYMIAGFFCLLGFLLSLLYATDAGLFFLDVVDFYINYVLLIVGFFESFGLGWVYDIEGQLEQFGAKVVFTYMFTTFGSILFACGFWFGLKEHNAVFGFVALILFYSFGILIVLTFLKAQGGGSFIDLAFGNMKKFKEVHEPVIGSVPTVWCVLIKHFVPHVLIVLFLNLATTTIEYNGEEKPLFGHYEGYPAKPYQALGIFMFCLALFIFLAGFFVPNLFSVLDTHELGAASAIEEAGVNKDVYSNSIKYTFPSPYAGATIEGHVFVSARFLGDETEVKARQLCQELQNLDVNIFIAEAGAGEAFGPQINHGLCNMVAFLAICSSNYGEKTESSFSSHTELKHAHQSNIPILPLKLCTQWPPHPKEDHDGGNEGWEQNQVVFRRDLLYQEWGDREWDAVECAKEIKVSLKKIGKCPLINYTNADGGINSGSGDNTENSGHSHQNSGNSNDSSNAGGTTTSIRRVTPQKQKHVFLSARFLNDETEKKGRELCQELKNQGIIMFIAEAGAGEAFGPQVNHGLCNMVAFLAICSSNYGEKTSSIYSSHYELKHAHQNHVPIIPLKICTEWPPHPKEDYGGGGRNEGWEQNQVVFRKDLHHCEWSDKDWDVVECAKEIKASLEKMGKCPLIKVPKLDLLPDDESHADTSSVDVV